MIVQTLPTLNFFGHVRQFVVSNTLGPNRSQHGSEPNDIWTMVKVVIYKYKEKRKYLDKNKIYNPNGQIIIFTNDLEELRKLRKFVVLELFRTRKN
jgi:hypothetical protein